MRDPLNTCYALPPALAASTSTPLFMKVLDAGSRKDIWHASFVFDAIRHIQLVDYDLRHPVRQHVPTTAAQAKAFQELTSWDIEAYEDPKPGFFRRLWWKIRGHNEVAYA